MANGPSAPQTKSATGSEEGLLEVPKTIQDLTGAVSEDSKVVNALWLIVATFSIYVIATVSSESLLPVQLPFDLGEIARTDFPGIAFIVLVALYSAFAAAFAHADRTWKLMHRLIGVAWADHLAKGMHAPAVGETGAPRFTPYLRELVDAIQGGPFNRVAPLAMGLHGTGIFFWDYEMKLVSGWQWKKPLSALFYFFLMVFSWGMFLALPVAAMASALGAAGSPRGPSLLGPLAVLHSFAVVLAILSPMIVVLIDAPACCQAFARIWSPPVLRKPCCLFSVRDALERIALGADAHSKSGPSQIGKHVRTAIAEADAGFLDGAFAALPRQPE